ncbi:hypothetical protein EYF80_008905 [Liparis tanakae]|uniref:Uncharacterized protein n=1 Tax=Liparis tanakae TaxID=230148 RepID=A0A4Z2ISC6_9TELE|nr:hypothetical protein EYF80_008905 [Liparis tanakae]
MLESRVSQPTSACQCRGGGPPEPSAALRCITTSRQAGGLLCVTAVVPISSPRASLYFHTGDLIK